MYNFVVETSHVWFEPHINSLLPRRHIEFPATKDGFQMLDKVVAAWSKIWAVVGD